MNPFPETHDGTTEELRPKIGVLIVAYNAVFTIRHVLSRIKAETWNRISEVFIFDDSSADETSQSAADCVQDQGLDKVRIFRNQINLGYGGNQKRGYKYAIERGFDIVVLLHGDGQYAPEVMDNLIDPIVSGEADAVMGSRMMEKGRALKGGMPLYKFVGNKTLTLFQNTLMGARMSEYHSGYRAYSVRALKKIPFMYNSNDFHFDNEIIVQLFRSDAVIREVPIPTYYGGEICYVNGLSYAWNVVMTVIRYKLHEAGLSYCRQFDVKAGGQYVFKHNRHSSHNQVLKLVQECSQGNKGEVLDVGCGSGELTSRLSLMGYQVVGIDSCYNGEAAAACADFIVTDIELGLGLSEDHFFDCIILADVLEHTRNPHSILLEARQHLKEHGRIIASSGNVANIYVRLALLMGQFNYAERGILDRTHSRLFTRSSFRTLLRESGFRIVRSRYTPIPFELIVRNAWISEKLTAFYMLAVRLWPSLFSYQVVLEAEPDPIPTEFLRNRFIDRGRFEDYNPGS